MTMSRKNYDILNKNNIDTVEIKDLVIEVRPKNNPNHKILCRIHEGSRVLIDEIECLIYDYASKHSCIDLRDATIDTLSVRDDGKGWYHRTKDWR